MNNQLWIAVPYLTEKNVDSQIKRIVVEVYNREGRNFERTQEIELFKEDGETPWRGAKNRPETYFHRGFMHKNSKHILIHSGRTLHVFDRSSGQRVHKNYENSTWHVTFWIPKQERFAWMDCACYSYLYMFKYNGYDPNSQISEQAAVLEPPIILDEIKSNIKSELNKLNEIEVTNAETGEKTTKKKTRSVQTYSTINTLMGIDESKTSSSEDVPALSTVEDIHEKTRAIIYSVISTESNYAIKAATYK